MTAWNQANYQQSLISHCWAYTPYDGGWAHCAAVRKDTVLRQLHAEEQALKPVPGWARDILERQITYLPGCPHATFPLPFLDVFDAIGQQSCLPFVHSCYTVPAERKERMIPYIDALLDWVAGRRPGKTPAFWEQLWQVLGPVTTTKSLLVQRLVHRLKWWCKAMTWDDDARDRHYQDEFLGDVCCLGDHYGNPQFRDPYWTELRTPAVQELEAKLADTCPEWAWYREKLHSTWLCGPKAFRYLERIIWSIGHVAEAQTLATQHVSVPPFLDCDDTYANMAGVPDWCADALAACDQFRAQGEARNPRQANLLARLGDYDPAKAWLVGIFARKLRLMPYAQAA
jgi:hypothetical protein